MFIDNTIRKRSLLCIKCSPFLSLGFTHRMVIVFNQTQDGYITYEDCDHLGPTKWCQNNNGTDTLSQLAQLYHGRSRIDKTCPSPLCSFWGLCLIVQIQTPQISQDEVRTISTLFTKPSGLHDLLISISSYKERHSYGFNVVCKSAYQNWWCT